MSYKVKDYMSKTTATIDADAFVFDASKLMSTDRRGYLIVLRQDQPTGIVTERDLVRKVMAQGLDLLKVKIADIMSTPLITVEPDASIEDAVKLMAARRIRRLPVMRQGILYGVFGARELAQNFNAYEDQISKDAIRSMMIFNAL